MVRAALSIVGILATIGVIVYAFGVTMPQMTVTFPGMRQSALHAASLEQSTATEYGREPVPDASPGPGTTGPNRAPADSAIAPQGSPETPEPPPSAARGVPADEAEIISPDSTVHLNPDHVHDIDQPTPAWATPAGNGATDFNPNPTAFVPPNPLPAQPHWTWDVGNREFSDVVVTHIDADLVTINSDSGPAQIDIAALPSEIQRQLNYNPALAAEAAASRKSQSAPIAAKAQ
jgi:hypothetical protein